MPDAKITDLTAETTVAKTDIVPFVDDPTGTPLDRKGTIANLSKGAEATNFPQASGAITWQPGSGSSVTITLASSAVLQVNNTSNCYGVWNAQSALDEAGVRFSDQGTSKWSFVKRNQATNELGLYDHAQSNWLMILSGLNFQLTSSLLSHSGARVLSLQNGTAPSSSPADSVHLYAEDVSSSSELKVRDEAGNVTTLSPHPHDAPKGLYLYGPGLDSFEVHRNQYVGEIRWFNTTKYAFDDSATKENCRAVETFDEYNARRGLKEGDPGFLVKEDWDENQEKLFQERSEEIEAVKAQNARIVEQRKEHARLIAEIEAANARTQALNDSVADPELHHDLLTVPDPLDVPDVEVPSEYVKKPKPAFLK